MLCIFHDECFPSYLRWKSFGNVNLFCFGRFSSAGVASTDIFWTIGTFVNLPTIWTFMCRFLQQELLLCGSGYWDSPCISREAQAPRFSDTHPPRPFEYGFVEDVSCVGVLMVQFTDLT